MLPRTAYVVVIGGGLIGCATARALAHVGLRTVVAERGRVDEEASAAPRRHGGPAGRVRPGQGRRSTPVLRAAVATLCRRHRGRERCRRKSIAATVPCTPRRTGRGATGLARRCDGSVRPGYAERPRGRTRGVARRCCRPTCGSSSTSPDDHRVNNERLATQSASPLDAPACASSSRRPQSGSSRARSRDCRPHDARRIATPLVVDAAGAWAADVGCRAGVRPPPVFPVRGQMLVLRTAPGTLACPLYSRDAHLGAATRRPRAAPAATYERVGSRSASRSKRRAGCRAAARAVAPGLTVRRLKAPTRAQPRDGRSPARRRRRARDHSGSSTRPDLPERVSCLAPLVAVAVAELVRDGRTRLPVAPFDPARFADTAAGADGVARK